VIEEIVMMIVWSQDAKRNNELMHSETSKREENKEALMDDKGNDGDDYGKFQDAARNTELVIN
jgi:hypothetical protein